MRSLSSIFLLLLTTVVFGQGARFHGIISENESGEPMIGVHIQNMTEKTLAITNVKGAFILPSEVGDSIVITHVGYVPQTFIMNEDVLQTAQAITLHTSITSLAEVEVNIFPEYWRFKQLILETEPVDSSIQFNLPKVVYYKHLTAQQLQDPTLAPVSGIRFDMDGLTKKGKERKKMQELLNNHSMKELAYRKFNRTWVADATKLSGDELTDFIAYCDFDIAYLANTSLFEIRKEMMALLEKFKKTASKKNNDQYTPGA